MADGRISGTAWCNQLSIEIFEALQILKSAYRNNHISAVNQATQHIDALTMGLEDSREEDM